MVLLQESKIRRGKDLLLHTSLEEVKSFENQENSLSPGFIRKLFMYIDLHFDRPT